MLTEKKKGWREAEEKNKNKNQLISGKKEQPSWGTHCGIPLAPGQVLSQVWQLTLTVWSREAVATLAWTPIIPQCRSVMGREWRDRMCRGSGAWLRSTWITLKHTRQQQQYTIQVCSGGTHLDRFHTRARLSFPPETKWLLSSVNFRQVTSW